MGSCASTNLTSCLDFRPNLVSVLHACADVTSRHHVQIVHINPSSFRMLTDMVNDETKGKGRVESMGSVGG